MFLRICVPRKVLRYSSSGNPLIVPLVPALIMNVILGPLVPGIFVCLDDLGLVYLAVEPEDLDLVPRRTLHGELHRLHGLLIREREREMTLNIVPTNQTEPCVQANKTGRSRVSRFPSHDAPFTQLGAYFMAPTRGAFCLVAEVFSTC